MARILQLFNVLGLPTERTMLEVAMGAADSGHSLTFAAEKVDPSLPPVTQPVRILPRIAVAQAEDIAMQMQQVANGPPEAGAAADFDMVHGHFGPRGLHASRYLQRGLPVVISCYGYDVSRLLSEPGPPAAAAWAQRYRWLGEHGACFAVLSEAMKRRLTASSVPSRAITIIPLGIELSRWPFSSSPLRLDIPEFLFVGRFVPKKGLAVALEALALLHARGCAARMRIVGGGEPAERQRLEALVRQLGLTGAVRWEGLLPYEALPAVMASASALVAPSLTAPDGDAEGCPMVLMQSQAVGTPVITTHHSGNAEALPPQARRFVVPEADAAALADAMQTLLKLSPLQQSQLSLSGRAWITQHFDLKQTIASYGALYTRLLSTRSALRN